METTYASQVKSRPSRESYDLTKKGHGQVPEYKNGYEQRPGTTQSVVGSRKGELSA